MAIDTAAKRKSVVAISLASLGPVVVPDSSFSQFDRQVIGYSYGGIAAGEAVDNTAGLVCMHGGTLYAARAAAAMFAPSAFGKMECS